jgi:rhodanese-related sulfurtransferase
VTSTHLRRVATTIATLLVLTVLYVGPRTCAGAVLDGCIALRFYGLASIDTATLATRRGVLLVDARTREEYDAGHLPGARFIDDLGDVRALRDREVVVYCSVGYRSALATQRLHARGVSRAKNLRGSLFRWANEGRPLTRSDGTPGCAHPYHTTWAMWVDASRRCPQRL